MPNWCTFTMRLKGKKENIETAIKWMTDYNEPRHCWRTEIFSTEEIKRSGDICVYVAYGECAWSVYSCMFSGEGTYEKDRPDQSITLSQIAKECALEIEVMSEESGFAFCEHYIINAEGEITCETCETYVEMYFDTEEEYEEEKKELLEKKCIDISGKVYFLTEQELEKLRNDENKECIILNSNEYKAFTVGEGLLSETK